MVVVCRRAEASVVELREDLDLSAAPHPAADDATRSVWADEVTRKLPVLPTDFTQETADHGRPGR